MTITPEQLEAQLIASILGDPSLRTFGNLTDQTVIGSSGTYPFPPITFHITGSASAVFYGDLQDLTLTDFQPDGSYADVTGNTFTFGKTTLTAGNNNNLIYDNLKDLTLDAEGNDTNSNGTVIGNDGSGSGSNTFTFSTNIITVGTGNNVVYGNLYDITLEANGDNLIGGLGVGGSTFTFSSNNITAGNGTSIGKDVIYGNLHDLSMSIPGLFPTPNYGTIGGIGGGGNTFTFGSNKIMASNRTSVIYGNLHDLTMSVSAFTGFGNIIGAFNRGDNSFTFGNNIINVENGTNTGTDLIYGNMYELNMMATDSNIGGLNQGFNNFIFENNTINVGNGTNKGTDTVYGNMYELNVTNTGTAELGSTIGGFNGGFNSFIFGNNTINMGEMGRPLTLRI